MGKVVGIQPGAAALTGGCHVECIVDYSARKAVVRYGGNRLGIVGLRKTDDVPRRC